MLATTDDKGHTAAGFDMSAHLNAMISPHTASGASSPLISPTNSATESACSKDGQSKDGQCTGGDSGDAGDSFSCSGGGSPTYSPSSSGACTPVAADSPIASPHGEPRSQAPLMLPSSAASSGAPDADDDAADASSSNAPPSQAGLRPVATASVVPPPPPHAPMVAHAVMAPTALPSTSALAGVGMEVLQQGVAPPLLPTPPSSTRASWDA